MCTLPRIGPNTETLPAASLPSPSVPLRREAPWSGSPAVVPAFPVTQPTDALSGSHSLLNGPKWGTPGFGVPSVERPMGQPTSVVSDSHLETPSPLSLEVRGVGVSSMSGSSNRQSILHVPLAPPAVAPTDGLVGSVLPLGMWEGGMLPHGPQLMNPHGGTRMMGPRACVPMSLPFSTSHM